MTPSQTAAASDPAASQEAQDALFARYRETVPLAGQIWNETLGVLLDHRTVRGYLPKPLAEGTLETLVAAAQSAPTSSGVQAWSVVAVEDSARKARLAALAGNQKHIVDAPLLLVWIADLSRISTLGEQRGVTVEGLDFTETFLVASVDATLAAQNAVVAAESLGLGTVYIGGMRNHPEAVAAEIGLPTRCYAVFGLVVGHPDPAVPTAIKPRLPQAAVLHRERYGHGETEKAAIARHDRHMGEFRREQKLSPTGWSELAVKRMETVAALKGRDVLRDVLGRLGFPLK